MRSLTDIVVKVERYDDEDQHSEIAVNSVIYEATEHAADFGYPTVNQMLSAYVQMSGLFCRVSFAAIDDMAFQAQEHRCNQTLVKDQHGSIARYAGDLCQISGPLSMLGPVDLGDTPSLWFYVPHDEVPSWLERIKEWLDTAMKADANRVGAGERLGDNRQTPPPPALRSVRKAS